MPEEKSGFIVPLEELLEAGVHFGHQSRRWNPKMKPYIYAVRDGVHIFDLAKTADRLKAACDYVKELGQKSQVIIFVGTKRQAQAIVKEEAQKRGAFFVTERWLGGTITNWDQIGKRVKKLEEMKQEREKGEYAKYTKKENVLINRKIDRLERFFGGIAGLKKIPEAIFVVDIAKEIAAVREARMKGVAIVAMVDSNADPELVDYVIPANDDAVRSIKLIVGKVAEAYAEGKALGEKGATRIKSKEPQKTQKRKDNTESRSA